MPRQRVLLGIHVKEVAGGAVPPVVLSAPGLRVGHRDVDVLVLDEVRRPETGDGRSLRETCQSLDLGYYRSPRPLGRPRALNLLLLRALSAGYDHVVTLDDADLPPLNLIDGLIKVAESNPGIGSVTAWSNALAGCSLPYWGDTILADRQEAVDWVSSELARSFGPIAVDLPASAGSGVLFPVGALREVGVFDPMYDAGRLNCVDWTLRSRTGGFRAALAPSTFVLHAPERAEERTFAVAGQEQVIRLRHPEYSEDADTFEELALVPGLVERAQRAVVTAAARRWGYEVELGSLNVLHAGDKVVVRIGPGAQGPSVSARYCWYQTTLDVGADVASSLATMFGRPPAKVTILEHGQSGDAAVEGWPDAIPVADHHMYPQRV